MVRRWSRQASILVTLVILVACGTPAAQPRLGPTPTPTARSIVATAGRLASPTRTTVVDRGIATTGATPGVSTARQGDLLLELRLDKAAFVAGEAGRGTVTARNVGSVPAGVFGGCDWASLQVLDGAGHFQPPPWSGMAISCPGILRTIPPGGEVASTLWFALPPADGATAGPYTLQARTSPTVTGPGNVTTNGTPLVTPPLAVAVTAPTPAQHLRATLLADRAGWRLTVTDQDGRVPPLPHWGVVDAGAPHTVTRIQLGDAPDGCWAGGWGAAFRDDAGTPITVRAWLAVPGYVLATATQQADPDAGTRLLPLGTPAIKCVPLAAGRS
jgi:hypothetical protein